MGPYADTALWVGLTIGCLIVAAASITYWRIRTGPHPLDYPSDEAYYAAKAQGRPSREPESPDLSPADRPE
jgi:hypothetical protein